MGDARREVRHIFLNNLFHEVGHLYAYLNMQVKIEELVLLLIYLVMVSFLTDVCKQLAAFLFR